MPRDANCPSLGRSRPQRMRMMVDFPAPFGPRKPIISPRRDLETHMVDGSEGAETFDEILDDDRARWPPALMPRPLRFAQATNRSSMVGATYADGSNGIRGASARGFPAGGARHRPRRHAHRRRPARCSKTPGSGASASRTGARICDWTSDGPGHRGLSACRRVAMQEAALVQQRETVAAFGLVQIGGRNQDRDALVARP